MKQPIKQFYEHKKKEEGITDFKKQIFDHFKNEYNLVN